MVGNTGNQVAPSVEGIRVQRWDRAGGVAMKPRAGTEAGLSPPVTL